MVSDRAYLSNGRTGAGLARLNAEIARLLSFVEESAQHIEPAALLPADILIDLYGEDLRARAYTTTDPVAGELMLRPDFTVPIVQIHAASKQTTGEYTYAGPVWRRQTPGSDRPNEYTQVGYESFGETNGPAAEARIFARFARMLSGVKLQPIVGDVSLLFAVVDALDTTERRKAALRRHIWRPARFKRLLDRYSTPVKTSELRAAALSAQKFENFNKIVADQGDFVGLRSISEIRSRIEALETEANTPRLSASDRRQIQDVLGLKTDMAKASEDFKKIAPSLTTNIENLAARADALADHNEEPANIPFDAAYGLRTMEYYDGFVFGFSAPNRPDLPQIAQGGRFDRLTDILGAATPAIGGIIRPEAYLSLMTEAA